MRTHLRLSLPSLLLSCGLLLVGACADAGGGTTETGLTGIQFVTLRVGEGVVFETKEIVKGNKFNAVDLYASANGDALKLLTGAETSTKNSPITWFPEGGAPRTFAQLADVPSDKPTDAQVEPLIKAGVGNGFVAKGFISEGYARGFISKSEAGSVSIEYELLPE